MMMTMMNVTMMTIHGDGKLMMTTHDGDDDGADSRMPLAATGWPGEQCNTSDKAILKEGVCAATGYADNDADSW